MVSNQNSISGALAGMIAQNRENSLQAGSTTSNVPEGTNLYFTAARGRSLISATSPLAYDSATGVVSANGLTQDVTVVTQTTPSVLTSVLHFTNGILTSIS